jgi:hypothetical protein
LYFQMSCWKKENTEIISLPHTEKERPWLIKIPGILSLQNQARSYHQTFCNECRYLTGYTKKTLCCSDEMPARKAVSNFNVCILCFGRTWD